MLFPEKLKSSETGIKFTNTLLG